MKKKDLLNVIRDMKRLWAQSLAQVDNTTGRRGIEMQLEAVEEMCDARVNPAIETMLKELGPETAGSALKQVPRPATIALPVVDDPRKFASLRSGNGGKTRRHRRGLRLVA